MNDKYGYIYTRRHESYSNACKLGKTKFILERDSQYATGELHRGNFDLVIEMSQHKIGVIEKCLQYYFKEFHIKFDGGSEFYDNQIIDLIVPYLQKTTIKFRVLSTEEINNLLNCYKLREIKHKTLNILKKFNEQMSPKNNQEIITYIPRDYQIDIISKSIDYFKTNDKGILVLTCGTGKTLISLWITQQLNSRTILIGVPSVLLLKQWEEIIKNFFEYTPCLLVCSDGIKTTIEDIKIFLQKHQNNCVVITTYISSQKVYHATMQINFKFDMKINDEVHHLTTIDKHINTKSKKNIHMLHILSKKQLSLTATLKHSESHPQNETIIFNNNKSYFGDIIDTKCLSWAIQQNILCNYVIQIIVTDENEQLRELFKIFDIKDGDMPLFLSAYSTLKSICDKNSHHALVFSNNKPNSVNIIKYIELLITHKYFSIPELYYGCYNSNMNKKDQTQVLTNYNSNKYGIISCVYCLGEGYDNYVIDAVIIAENMQSDIRIVQTLLRGSRKNINEPTKITKIILPLLNNNNFLENDDNSDFKKVSEIINQMGLQDETIIHKVKVFKIEIEKQKYKIKENVDLETVKEFGKYDDNLTQQLRLITIKSSENTMSYEKTRKLLIEKNIQSKDNYYKLCDEDNRFCKNPEIIFKEKFIGWIDYLGIERKYYDLKTCKNKVREYLLMYPNIKKYYVDLSIMIDKLCVLDHKFPPNGLWVDYYDVKNLQDIIKIMPNKKKVGMIF